MGSVVLAGATSGSTTLTPVDAVTATITLPSATGTLLATTSTFAGTGPAFRAVRASSAQTLTDGVLTKLQFNSETYDTASCYDSATNYRFTPNVAGYYEVIISANFQCTVSRQYSILPALYKNGSNVNTVQNDFYLGSSLDNARTLIVDTIYLNGSSDYIEAFSQNYDNTSSGTTALKQSTGCYFSAALIRAA